ncbi:SidA/IucD/PvdA family monooxygenase [Kordia sp. YSTF-M3]|uniref:SidA/IucD/PvdA family monooxygenase n=1 Tax=Kordia aestuariivivens TaxID=2759037 RepID=A0ABR7QEB7_9FLAO|nr:SidA/IucD/PvdA family monooxygenase [Kordia aestuariivivens]MBC8756877.1 SidA/IucD/PvdA family monooxygenase [Kordia aestuariivivens]
MNNNNKDFHKNNFYDTIGVGFGPSNIALAVAHQEMESERTIKFLDASTTPGWQLGVTIPGSDIQHNPLRDFATPRNPRSQFGYLSYLQDVGRLLDYLNLDAPYPPRSEYSKYVEWVAKRFDNLVSYDSKVKDISIVESDFEENVFLEIKTSSETYKARSISFAPGRSHNIPKVFKSILSKKVAHFTKYNLLLQQFSQTKPKRIAIIGGSQSAVEIILDLHAKFPETEIICIHRKFSFVLKDTSPFTEDLLLPENIDYFYNSSKKSKNELSAQIIRSNYGSVDEDILKELYFTLYENRLHNNNTIQIYKNQEVIEAYELDNQVQLKIKDLHTGALQNQSVDAVILGTGFRNFGARENEELIHPLLENIKKFYKREEDGTFSVTRDYQLIPVDGKSNFPKIYLNGLCESTHGLADAGSFSHLSLRAALIEKSMVENLQEKSPQTICE